jgi:hydroxyacylglutathione hydrolase
MSRPIRCAIAAAVLLNVAAAGTGQTAGAGSGRTAGGVQAAEPWYKATRVADKVWRIDDHGNDNLYLIEGTKQALLVDTGLGASKLGEFVKTLTTLPIVVVNTHGHGDHAGGNNFFPTVYAHPAEFDAIRAMNNPQGRRNAAERFAKSTPGVDIMSPEEQGRLAATPATLLPLKDGQIFDLGGRTLEVIEQPGHTPGEVVLLDKANRLVFGGDNNNTLVWLWMPNSRPLDVYLTSLKTLKQRSADFDTILPGHGGPLPASHLDDQIACVEDILSGHCTGEPYQQSRGMARVCAHGPASVAFDPKNLRAEK